jgi:two-component system sensor histidine kinase DegS
MMLMERQQDADAVEQELAGDGSLKKILTSTIHTIEDNKAQVFEIYETAKEEVEACRRQLNELKKQTREVIDRVDVLAVEEQKKKQELVRVSGNFAHYSEERIRASYEEVKNVQVELGVERDKEQQLRLQRDNMELRLRRLGGLLDQAEHLALAIGSVLSYLANQFNGVVWKIEAVQKDKFVGARIIRAQEEERYRLSRELHDGPAQDMANLIFQTSIVEKLVDYDPDEAKHSLQELRQQIRDCLTSVRQVIFDMRPMALDDLGLEAALSQLVQKLAQRGIVYARFEADGKRYDLPKHVEIAVFRIVQEALANVAHHSGQNKAMVRMLYSTGALSVLIEDHGCGFDMDADQKAQGDEDAYGLGNQESHFGMVSMEERARLIGAELQVTSKPGKGTRVHLRVERNVSRAAAEEKQAKEAARQVQAARQQERKAAEAKEAAVKARQEAARLAAKGQELAVEVEPAEKA